VSLLQLTIACISLNTSYSYATIVVVSVKFHSLSNDANINLEKYIEYIIPKLSLECTAMSEVISLTRTDTLKLLYIEYFQAASCGITSGRKFNRQQKQYSPPKRKLTY
jgi:hypothetical protein